MVAKSFTKRRKARRHVGRRIALSSVPQKQLSQVYYPLLCFLYTHHHLRGADGYGGACSKEYLMVLYTQPLVVVATIWRCINGRNAEGPETMIDI